MDFYGFEYCWIHLSAQLYKIYNVGLVIFRHFNLEILHIVHLSPKSLYIYDRIGLPLGALDLISV